MGGRMKKAEPQPIEYTRYIYDPEKIRPWMDFDPECLEETSTGPVSEELIEFIEREFPGSVGDSDGDGYREMDSYAVEIAAAELGLSGPFPLAALFVDDPIPAVDAKGRDCDFARIAREAENPLKAVSEPLERYLRNTGVHVDEGNGAISGLPAGADLHQTTGFSVDGRGRLRIDCKIFAELAYELLEGIPGLEFHHVRLDGKRRRHEVIDIANLFGAGDQAEGHLILLVSDGKGNNLRIDNESVSYYRAERPDDGISKIYRCSYDAGYIRAVGSEGEWRILFRRNPDFNGNDGCGPRFTVPNFS